jgi:hypothetical protein
MQAKGRTLTQNPSSSQGWIKVSCEEFAEVSTKGVGCEEFGQVSTKAPCTYVALHVLKEHILYIEWFVGDCQQADPIDWLPVQLVVLHFICWATHSAWHDLTKPCIR